MAIDPQTSVVNVTNVNSSITTETLMNLESYTKYEISITAVTIGEGPYSTLIQRTNENGILNEWIDRWKDEWMVGWKWMDGQSDWLMGRCLN